MCSLLFALKLPSLALSPLVALQKLARAHQRRFWKEDSLHGSPRPPAGDSKSLPGQNNRGLWGHHALRRISAMGRARKVCGSIFGIGATRESLAKNLILWNIKFPGRAKVTDVYRYFSCYWCTAGKPNKMPFGVRWNWVQQSIRKKARVRLSEYGKRKIIPDGRTDGAKRPQVEKTRRIFAPCKVAIMCGKRTKT